MHGRFRLPAAVLTLLLAGAALQAREGGDELRKRVDKAVERVYPALVQIYVVTVNYEDGREQKFEAAGSGAIFTPDGHVITNHHVAGKAKRIRCILTTKEELEGALVGTDPLSDIAVVKLDLSQRKAGKDSLPVAAFGDSDKLRVGDHVLAMGSPVALSQSVTLGIVSNTGFTMPRMYWAWKQFFKMDGEDTGSLVRWIGHDAAIYGGNSGGPLVDLEGRIVGINEISFGLGGAIPANLARDVAEQIVKHGKVMRSWIGVECQPLLKGSDREDGALIASIVEGSPGAQAGLKPGDVLLAFNGRKVAVRFEEEIPEFNRMVLSTPVGAEVPVEILRGGEKLEFKLTTALREPARGDEEELKNWGLTARQITEMAAKELKRPDKSGAFVWSVRPGGPSGEAKPALASGDVIVEVGGTAVSGLAHLRELTDAIVKGQEKPVPTLIAFDRQGAKFLTVVKLGVSEEAKRPDEVNKAWLPAAYQVFTADLAESMGLKGATGVRITQVFPKSTAEAAGLQVGDILTHLDGQAIDATQPEDIEVLAQMIRAYKIGSEAELTVLREPKREKTKLSVKLEARPVPETRVEQYEDLSFEFKVRDVAYMDRIKNRWAEDRQGALVVEVKPGGWAALAHLAVGDMILAVDGKPVTGAGQLEARMKEIAAQRPRHVSFFVLRGISTLFVELEPAWAGR
ncbi:MAG: PDZ domain-containing protein [Planctomycetota bacterium]|nr:PDZ domain-containing protein [Planctomycetota bacterium]